MVFESKPFVLMIKGGKYVTVQKYGSTMKLCAEDLQNGGANASYVNIWTREGKEKKNQMAFRFKCGNDYYFPKVDVTVDGSLTLELATSGDTPDNKSDNHWFEKDNVGGNEHYHLRSVFSPKQFLSVTKGYQSNFILSPKPVLVRVKEI